MCVFKRRLKVSVQSILLRDSGREFHEDGSVTQDALSSNLLRVEGVFSVPRSRWCRRSVSSDALSPDWHHSVFDV